MAQWDTRGVKWVLSATAVAVMAGCAGVPEAQGPLRKEPLHVLTQKMELLTLNAGQPGKVLQRTAVTGLPPGETLVGMDYRIAKGVLFVLTATSAATRGALAGPWP